jgi:hypothetical protein
MLSLVIVGSSRTRRLDLDPPRLYTPRGYFAGGRPVAEAAQGSRSGSAMNAETFPGVPDNLDSRGSCEAEANIPFREAPKA